MILDEIYALSEEYLESNNLGYERHYLVKHVLKHRLSVIIGQRGVGKTTMIAQYLLNQIEQGLAEHEVLYIPVDHFLLSNYSLYEIAEAFMHVGGKLIAFDEIHKYPDWSKTLKSIYDTFPTLKIIASGSSALEIYKGSHDLSRRAITYYVPGLSFREYLELNHQFTLESYTLETLLNNHHSISKVINKQLAEKSLTILKEFKRYLKTGYYPYFMEFEDERLFFITIEQNFHFAIDSDLVAAHPSLNGHSLRKLKQLLGFIAENIPFQVNFRKLKTTLNISDERTLKNYLKYLEDLGLIKLLGKSSRKLAGIESPEKIYLNNTNQLHAISQQSSNIGTVRELFFLSMLDYEYKICASKSADFLVEQRYSFEIGGKSKSHEQIKHEHTGFLACDDIPSSQGNKIPLWLFGFLY